MATGSTPNSTPQALGPLTKRKAWKALQAHYKNVHELHLRKLFAEDPRRGERMTAEAVGIFLDYSKNRINGETIELLIQLADESGLRMAARCDEKHEPVERLDDCGCAAQGRINEPND